MHACMCACVGECVESMCTPTPVGSDEELQVLLIGDRLGGLLAAREYDLQNGAAGVLYKPFEMNEFLAQCDKRKGAKA